jgi:hypothetical protein
MAIALRRHDAIMRAAIKAASGYDFKTVGDALRAGFETAQLAAEAAVAAQRALGAEEWPTSRPIRVRMGLHTRVCLVEARVLNSLFLGRLSLATARRHSACQPSPSRCPLDRGRRACRRAVELCDPGRAPCSVLIADTT